MDVQKKCFCLVSISYFCIVFLPLLKLFLVLFSPPFQNPTVVAKVANFNVVSIDEDQIAANLVKNGPLAMAINAVYMQTCIGGVSCPYLCSKRLDHGVLLVGYSSTGYSPIRMKEKPYWIIKNSWGGSWGENGFYKICRVRNVCGVESMVSAVGAVVKWFGLRGLDSPINWLLRLHIFAPSRVSNVLNYSPGINGSDPERIGCLQMIFEA